MLTNTQGTRAAAVEGGAGAPATWAYAEATADPAGDAGPQGGFPAGVPKDSRRKSPQGPALYEVR